MTVPSILERAVAARARSRRPAAVGASIRAIRMIACTCSTPLSCHSRTMKNSTDSHRSRNARRVRSYSTPESRFHAT